MHFRPAFFFVFPIILFPFSLAQPTFTAHVISTSADGLRSVYATDLDDDGDMDILSASANLDKIV